MVTAALVSGMLAWWACASVCCGVLANDRTDDVDKGASCVMIPVSLAISVFIAVAIFRL